MKKKLITLLLLCTMTLASCTNMATVATSESASEAVQSQAVESSEEVASVEPSTEVAPAPVEEVQEATTKGGTPWIDSDLKENVTADMATSAKDDFHLFVNRDWIANAQIPAGQTSWSPFGVIATETTEKSLALLTDPNLKGHDAELIQSLYKAYLDWDARNALGVAPLQKAVDDIKGIENMDQLSDFICDPDRSYGVPTLLAMGNGQDFIDSDKYLLYIVNDDLSLGDAAEYKQRTELGDLYYAAAQYLSVAMLTRLGYTQEEALRMYDDSIAFETKLAENAFTSADQMSPNYIAMIYNVYGKDELTAASPNFPLMRFLKSFGYDKAKEYLVIQPQVLQTINDIYNEENLEALKNYMIVRFSRSVADSLDREAFYASTAASNMLNGSEGMLSDEQLAYNVVTSMLSVPMNRAYLEKYDATETKERITELIKEIIAVYRDMLSEETWLSEETRAKAIEKLDNIKIKAVYPEKWLDCSKLNLKGLSYWDCQKAISDFSQELDVSHVNGRVDKELWSANILDANAYYEATDNSINIILGLLGGDFYHDGMSDEELFGGIGAVIGHEISHAFDTSGSQFDKDGNMANWWTDSDYVAFQERASKLIAYYNNMTVWGDAKVFGANIQTEAIADMAGIKALLKLAESKENFDYEKFFTSYANVWKEVATYEFEYYIYAQDTHPLNFLRTNATLQQFDEFIKTYDVKEGDGMYLAPENRVLVW